ncbi:MAG: glycosyltransferase family 2 protein, partial [Solimonas sp.]
MGGLRFSVAINNYNYGRFLSEALASVLAQTYRPFEIIVVDDGSTDGSAQWLRETCGDDPRVRLILQDNGGQLSAIRAAVDASRGDVVCFLDADDTWTPDHLQGLADAYERAPCPDAVYVDLLYVGARSGSWIARYAHWLPAGRDHDCGLMVLLAGYSDFWLGVPTSGLSMRRRYAVRALDLPPEIATDWPMSVDTVLIRGAAMSGAS